MLGVGGCLAPWLSGRLREDSDLFDDFVTMTVNGIDYCRSTLLPDCIGDRVGWDRSAGFLR